MIPLFSIDLQLIRLLIQHLLRFLALAPIDLARNIDLLFRMAHSMESIYGLWKVIVLAMLQG